MVSNLYSQGIPYGEEFQINSYTNGEQSSPKIALLLNGRFVVCWNSNEIFVSKSSVFGQMYNKNGTPSGGEFQINTSTQGFQSSVTVASLMDSGFVCCWCSTNYEESVYGIFGQLFDLSGNRKRTEFQINTSSQNKVGCPTIAVLSSDDFVVCWYEVNNLKNTDADIYGQLFDISGNKKGNEFQVNTDDYRGQSKPKLSALSNGRFVVCWDNYHFDNISGQLFDANGNKLGDEFQVNTYSVSYQSNPSVAAFSNGGFVVCWQSSAQDGDHLGIFAQIFNCSGNKIEDEFQVNTHTQHAQSSPSITSFPDDSFVICWRSNHGDQVGIYGQRFDDNGCKIWNEFRINSYIYRDQAYPSVTRLTDGVFVVCWWSQYLDVYGDIFGKLFPLEALNHQLINFSLIEPPNDVTITVTHPCFHWQQPGNTIECYPWELTFDLYIDTDYNFSNPQIIKDIQDTTYTIDSLTPGQTYFWKVLAKNLAGDSLWSTQQDWGFFISHNATSVETADENVPKQFELFQNYPNPFNYSTEIKYSLPQGKSSQHIVIRIYDITCRMVKVLVDHYVASGTYSICWNGTDVNGNAVASGVYFYSLEANEFKTIKKMLLIH